MPACIDCCTMKTRVDSNGLCKDCRNLQSSQSHDDITMPKCIMCRRMQSGMHPLTSENNISSECIENLNNHNYVLTSTNDCSNKHNIRNISITSQCSCDEENNLTFVDASGKLTTVNIIDDEIQIENSPDFSTKEDFKDALLASLYAQVEFLKNEMTEIFFYN